MNLMRFLILLTTCLHGVVSPLTVGTYNVMCSDDEYNEYWGVPLQIASCSEANRNHCTAERRTRQWGMIESMRSSVDALLLQEVEQAFLDLKGADSHYSLLARSGQCAILALSTVPVVSTFNLTIPDQTGCEFAPAVTLSSGITLVTGKKGRGQDRVEGASSSIRPSMRSSMRSSMCSPMRSSLNIPSYTRN